MTVKLCATIQLCVAFGKSLTQTYNQIKEAGAVIKSCPTLVFKWQGQFKAERECIEDYIRQGRPALKKQDTVTKVKDVLDQDRRFTVRTISMK